MESELKELTPLIDSWSGFDAVEKLNELRDHLRKSKMVTGCSVKGITGEPGGSKGLALFGASGLEAVRSQDSIDTLESVKQALASDCDFMDALDILISSRSKPWHMLGLGKLKGKTTHVAMESCSQFVKSWDKFWIMSIGDDPDGDIPLRFQSVGADSKDLAALLEGR